MKGRRTALRLAILTAGLALLLAPSTATAADELANLEITEFSATPSTLQAGAPSNTRLFMRFCDPGVPVAGAGNTSPIVITTATPHGADINPASQVLIRDVRGNTAANGVWGMDPVVENGVPSTTKFSLRGSAGNGDYTGGGFAQVPQQFGCVGDQGFAPVRDFRFILPPGMLGDPTSLPTCPYALWTAASCPPDTVVGHSVTRLRPSNASDTLLLVPSPVYNVQTLGLEPARLGTRVFPSDPAGPFPIAVTMRNSGDYGLNSALIDIPRNLGGVLALPLELETYLCGPVPCAPTDVYEPSTIHPLPGAANTFFRNPASCRPTTVGLEAVSWMPGGVTDTAQSKYQLTGCDQVPFSPVMRVEPDLARGGTDQAGAATAHNITIEYPDYDNAPVWQSALRRVDLTLPEGVTLSPGAGAALEACSAEQFGFDLSTGHQDARPARCPEGSRIGSLRLDSHVLPTPLIGSVFFGPATRRGRPTADSPWRLFLLMEGNGLRIKVAGDVTLDENGNVRNLFVDQPELPWRKLELKLNGGERAVLANPVGCGEHRGAAVLEGWSGGESRSVPAISATGCPDPRPFHPVVEEATSTPDQAGAQTTSRIVISRADGERDIKNLKLSLPAGAAGMLGAVPQCPIAQARTGTCPDSSKIGNIKNTVGSDRSLLTVQGSLYLAEPSAPGDAATIAMTVPARAGPIDLGQIVLINRVLLRPHDTGVDIVSSDIPRVFEGVPLPLRRIEITVDRQGFFLNPTGCEPRPLTAEFTAHDGATATSTVQVSAKRCEEQSFSPRLRLIAGAQGQTKPGTHPPLTAIVTQEAGEAAIANARVVLPDPLRPNVPFLNEPGALCNDAQLAARACPALSVVGRVKVVTPLLPFALEGPVHIVQEFGSILPNLVALARGNGLEVLLRAFNRIEGVRTVNNFRALPDVSQTYFELSINGGKNGILNAFFDLCKVGLPARQGDAVFTAHSGSSVTLKPMLELRGCGQPPAASTLGGVVRVTRSGTAPVRVSCRLTRRCRGRLVLHTAQAVRASAKARRLRLGSARFSIPARRAATVRVKLSHTAMRTLKRKRHLRTRASMVIGGAATARSAVVLLAP